jgi:hypothetical protein
MGKALVGWEVLPGSLSKVAVGVGLQFRSALLRENGSNPGFQH